MRLRLHFRACGWALRGGAYTNVGRRRFRSRTGSAHQFNPAGDVCLIAIVVRQFQVTLVVARFAFQQAVVEAAQLFVQVRHQRGKTLATARLDERPQVLLLP